ncbi:unnamed protein product [Schistosoma margrebowiei]|uniref:Uncharacterized protein n=1 Tax=Schistosoma margrebowiei TaxID=48269 RepID=A0A183N4S8_9TREM|nr:unnamed protein product [Schistosoma margrebowiei]
MSTRILRNQVLVTSYHGIASPDVAPIPCGSELQIVVGGSQQETLDPSFVLLGTRQQGVPVILMELVLSIVYV